MEPPQRKGALGLAVFFGIVYLFTAGCWPLMWLCGGTFKDLLAPQAAVETKA